MTQVVDAEIISVGLAGERVKEVMGDGWAKWVSLGLTSEVVVLGLEGISYIRI